VRGTVATTRRRTINGGGRRSRGKANLAVVLVLVAAWHGRSPSVGGRARRVSAIIPASLQHRATSAWTPLEVAPTTSSRGSELPPMIPTPPSHSTVDLNSVKVNQNAKCLSIRVQIQSRLMTAKIILQNRRHKDTQTRRKPIALCGPKPLPRSTGPSPGTGCRTLPATLNYRRTLSDENWSFSFCRAHLRDQARSSATRARERRISKLN